MRPLLSLSFVVFALSFLAGCPQPLVAEENWQPVEGAPTTRSAVSEEQRKEVQRIALEGRVRKMRAALVSEADATCTKDDECELTSFHCCNCASGGKMSAANKEKLPQLLQRRGIICEDYACAQVVSDDPTCSATTAVCREGKCVPDVKASAPTGVQGVGTEPIPDEPAAGEQAE